MAGRDVTRFPPEVWEHIRGYVPHDRHQSSPTAALLPRSTFPLKSTCCHCGGRVIPARTVWIYGYGVHISRACFDCVPGRDKSLWYILGNLDDDY